MREDWSGVFRQVIFAEMPVEKLGKHFNETIGRPTKELYSISGFLLLKEMFNRTEDGAVKNYIFNTEVQYALNLGRDNLQLDIRTLQRYEKIFRDDLFEDYCFNVDVAFTHVDLVTKFLDKQPPVVLIDMPFSNRDLKREGLQSIRDVREFISLKEQPIAIAIGHIGDDGLNEAICFEAGSDYFFEKPISLPCLSDVFCERGLLVKTLA